ncbi:MAG: undecaprenyl-diphosphate phosphatase [Bacilli bacterium]|jgi:undecaprenyl-diphosphatase
MDYIEILKYILLGLVQGISEIFPISSSGHLIIFQNILDIEMPGLVFEMFTNTASFLALILLFAKDIWILLKGFFRFIFKKETRKEDKETFLYVLKLALAVIPIGVAGLIFKDRVSELKSLLFVGLALSITGALLLAIFLTRKLIKEHENVTFKDAFIMGLTQAFAIIPGISRSGSTIIGGRASRLSLKSVLKFSFLAYLVISIPTSFLNIYELTQVSESINWLGYSLAFIVTFGATYLTARLVMKKLEVKHLIIFSAYCLVVGAVMFVLHFVL